MDFTKEQEQAINEKGTNIIVSAGAGSGKTAVLTERAKRKVLNHTKVNELLILTFTNAAAAEMKDRIREAIKSVPELKDELNNLDSAYISTFDAFNLAIVKKYHTRLNISNNVGISDEILIDLKKKEILNNIFNEYYLSPTKDFLKLINDFCFKETNELKGYILNAYKKIELKYDKTAFLNNYFNEFNNIKIDSFIEEYMNLIRDKQKVVIDKIEELYNYFDSEFVQSIKDALTKFINAKTYEDFLKALDYKLPSVPRGSDKVGQDLKNSISKDITNLRDEYLLYENVKEIKDEIEATYSNTKVIIDILIKLDKEIEEYKYQNELFNFNDISRMAILLLENNEDIRNELKYSFKEIMIDEYQDTSDTQEKFISLISNNNVYMVGDIKQSIYRFRNANPNIFKEKYDKYSKKDNGIKIDLLNNYRSRREVLQDIDTIFDFTMDLDIGGADYINNHRMIFGNTSYEKEGNTNQDYHMNIITYNEKELNNISNSEEEAFIIGNDIKNKINSNYQIFDKKKKVLRSCTYKDFVILLDKGKDFNLYKKIFEYLQIPLTILKEEDLNKDNDILIFKNLFKLILNIKDNNFDNEFKYCFISISRSYLYKLDDEEIYDIFVKDRYKETELYNDCLLLAEELDNMNVKAFFRKILEITNYDEKLLTITNIKSNRIRCEYIYNLIDNYEATGGTFRDFINYLDQVFEEDYKLQFNVLGEVTNSCTIETIHKSKGLEYPICYYAGFKSKFNLNELKEKILFDNKYGLVLPYVNEYYKDTIIKKLLKNKITKEDIGERIRLLYVALTRAKEKVILVMPEQDEEKEVRDVLPIYEREKYISFLSLFKSIYTLLLPYITKTDVEGTKAYLFGKARKEINKLSTNIEVQELNIESNIISEKHYSKEKLHLYTKEEKNKMEYGTKVHEYLEQIDFSNQNSINLIEEVNIKNNIKAFLDSDLMKNRLNNKMYKEYEFIYNEDSIKNHGIIDLLIDDNDKYIIVDYKLKNIDDELYDKQLNGYRKYIEDKTNKKCLCYLYSIIDNTYREVKQN